MKKIVNHREIIHKLKRTRELNLCQISLKFNGRPQYHVLMNKEKWLLNHDHKW